MTELRPSKSPATNSENMTSGAATFRRLTPQLRIAVTSLFRANIPRVSRVAIKMASGAIWKTMAGSFSRKYASTV